jgi:hypothetical protein
VNRSIKQALVNDCLSDPIIYAGHEHARLRRMMKSALCAALDLRYDEASGTCVVRGPTVNQPILVVSESLGSKLVFDAMLDLGSADGGSSAFQRAMAAVPQIYMLANQLPLLDLAIPGNPPGEGARSVTSHSDGTAHAVADLLVRRVRIVAPNSKCGCRWRRHRRCPSRRTEHAEQRCTRQASSAHRR